MSARTKPPFRADHVGSLLRPERLLKAREEREAGRITSIPNLIGLARIAATPVVMVLLLVPFAGAGLIAFIIFGVAALSDTVDGRIARARGQVSPLGVFMDLTADKVLVAGVLIAMVEVGLLPAWLVAILIIRELVIAGVRQLAAAANDVMAARGLGKAKTVITLLGMGLLLLAFDARTDGPLAPLGVEAALTTSGFWLLVVATVLAVLSALDYLRSALPTALRNG
jgi:CDP-diacylglycerol---glycerol-3-phosphate 3-phosphatidyltransferase